MWTLISRTWTPFFIAVAAAAPAAAPRPTQIGINLTVVGPEAPLVAGIVDVFKARELTIFGPSAKAAEIEGSKIFSKELMEKYGVPTAFFKVCDNLADARAFVEEKGAPIVIKADGLAAGKGVVVARTKD